MGNIGAFILKPDMTCTLYLNLRNNEKKRKAKIISGTPGQWPFPIFELDLNRSPIDDFNIVENYSPFLILINRTERTWNIREDS